MWIVDELEMFKKVYGLNLKMFLKFKKVNLFFPKTFLFFTKDLEMKTFLKIDSVVEDDLKIFFESLWCVFWFETFILNYERKNKFKKIFLNLNLLKYYL